MNKSDFIVFRKLKIGPPRITERKVSAVYTLLKPDGAEVNNELVYSYEEAVFVPDDPASQNLASMMVAQVAINYGLFCHEIEFDGLYGETDKSFIKQSLENTSREIYVNKLLHYNEFLHPDYRQIVPEKSKTYTEANIHFTNTAFGGNKFVWNKWDVSRSKVVILSSGGKDSLLTYGLTKEMGYEVHPVYINESGRHWFTALNAFRHHKNHEPNTVRVWCNSDRMFNWMLHQMPFIRSDFSRIRADYYPIRLWTVAVFLFGVLPIARKRQIGHILIGDEYDTTLRMNYEGITHYAGLYDQSKYFDNALTRYFLRKGWMFFQFSLLRSLSELLIMKVLVSRYPELQANQVSCHAAHEHEGRIYPCGKCEKCRRIVGMLMALGHDPTTCGYSQDQIDKALKSYATGQVKQFSTDAQQLFHMLTENNLIESNEHTKKMAKEHAQIMKLRFDNERSLLNDIPVSFREPLFEMIWPYTYGASKLVNREWVNINLQDLNFNEPYPFEIKQQTYSSQNKMDKFSKEYLWEHLSWPELEERLKVVDTALLPCGAIEQHGPHLPVDIDYSDANFLARKVAEACSDPKPLVLPPLPYGVSYHHDDFKGTISVSNESLSRLVYDIGMSLAKNGIKKMIIINGHGDNAPTLNFAAQMINRDAQIFVCVDTGETSDEDLGQLSETENDIHAGEIETSTSLSLRPELVQMDKAVKAIPKFGSSYLDYSSSRGVPWYVRTRKLSDSGVLGDPTQATAEKGNKMWEVMVAHLVKFVEVVKSSDLQELYQKKY